MTIDPQDLPASTTSLVLNTIHALALIHLDIHTQLESGVPMKDIVLGSAALQAVNARLMIGAKKAMDCDMDFLTAFIAQAMVTTQILEGDLPDPQDQTPLHFTPPDNPDFGIN